MLWRLTSQNISISDCATVKNSPCNNNPLVHHHPPMCGQVEGFNYQILNDHINPDEMNTNITVNVTFRSTLLHRKPLYFVAFYGDAKPFDREIDVSLTCLRSINNFTYLNIQALLFQRFSTCKHLRQYV